MSKSYFDHNDSAEIACVGEIKLPGPHLPQPGDIVEYFPYVIQEASSDAEREQFWNEYSQCSS